MQMDLQATTGSKFIATKTGKMFTKVQCLFPDGGTYSCTIFDRMEVQPGQSISANVDEDKPYNGQRQFRLNQPIFIGGGPTPGATTAMPGQPSPPSCPPVGRSQAPTPSGYTKKAMSYDESNSLMRILLTDAYVLINEVVMKQEIQVNGDTMLERASALAISNMIAINRGELEAPADIPF